MSIFPGDRSPRRLAVVAGLVAVPVVAAGAAMFSAQAAGTYNVAVTTDTTTKSVQVDSAFGANCVNLNAAGTYGLLSNYGGGSITMTAFANTGCAATDMQRAKTVQLADVQNVTVDLRKPAPPAKPPVNNKPVRNNPLDNILNGDA